VGGVREGRWAYMQRDTTLQYYMQEEVREKVDDVEATTEQIRQLEVKTEVRSITSQTLYLATYLHV
jgi:hypothetical protein